MDEDLASQLSCIIRVGVISSTNPEKHTCRVAFPECRTGSYELPILERNALNNADAQMYDVGESVLCIFLPDGPEDGFIIGAFYAEPNVPPTNSQDERRVLFADDTSVTYNRSSHELDLVDGDTQVHVDRDCVNINTPKAVNIVTRGNILLNASGNIDIKAGGTVALTGASVKAN